MSLAERLRRAAVGGTIVGAVWFVLLMIVQLGLGFVVPWWLAFLTGLGLGVIAAKFAGAAR